MVTPVFYSAALGGFFDPDSGVPLPADATEITRALYAELLAGQSAGGMIVPGPDGAPMLQMPVPLTEAQELEAWRAGTSVTAYQAKAALYNRGLLDDAEAAAVAAGGLVLLAWQTATHFQRSAASITALAPAIGIATPEDLDDLFREASAISA
jgi:hypothetical protein